MISADRINDFQHIAVFGSHHHLYAEHSRVTGDIIGLHVANPEFDTVLSRSQAYALAASIVAVWESDK